MEDSEKRHLHRRHLIYYLRLFDRDSNLLVGYLVDLSEDGLMIMNEEGMEQGRIYHLRMELPEEFFGKTEMTMDGEVRWVKPDVNPRFKVSGLALTRIAHEDQMLIEDMIDQYGFVD